MPRVDGRGFAGWLLIALTAEKVVQHIFVTWAFAADRFGIRDDVVVDYRWLMVIGGAAAALFAVALVGLLNGTRWSLTLLTVLALVDIVGEFIAQGRVSIVVTVSFIVAIIIFVLARREARHMDRSWEGVVGAGGKSG